MPKQNLESAHFGPFGSNPFFTNGPFKKISKFALFAGGPWDLPHKFHLYLIFIFDFAQLLLEHPNVFYS
jgi:hypothetical protein